MRPAERSQVRRLNGEIKTEMQREEGLEERESRRTMYSSRVERHEDPQLLRGELMEGWGFVLQVEERDTREKRTRLGFGPSHAEDESSTPKITKTLGRSYHRANLGSPQAWRRLAGQ